MLSIRTLLAGLAVAGALVLAPAAAQASEPPTETCSFLGTRFCYPDGGMPLNVANSQDAGPKKQMQSLVNLNRTGLMKLNHWTKNSQLFASIYPRVLVVPVDNQNRPIWVSKIVGFPMVCGILNEWCGSTDRRDYEEQFPAVIGHYAADVRIYHGDDADYRDLRAALIDRIKADVGLTPEVRVVTPQLH